MKLWDKSAHNPNPNLNLRSKYDTKVDALPAYEDIPSTFYEYELAEVGLGLGLGLELEVGLEIGVALALTTNH